MFLPEEDFIETIRREADLNAAVGENLRRLIALGRGAGIPGTELARASGLSKAAIAEITVKSGRPARERLDPAEIAALLALVKNVALVAAGGVGYREYRTYSAYICQNRRFFSRDVERFGFYSGQEVKPEFPKILDIAHDVAFTPEAVDGFRSEGREALARIVERVIADGARNTTDQHSVYALSGREDEETLRLTAPIRHTTTGPGTGFVQKQRYVSEQALRKEPKTTRELLELDGD
ncbi:MAG: hypothetical protein ABSB24_13255 [Gaiellaceae bacterium]|jgi:hypothetical protein